MLGRLNSRARSRRAGYLQFLQARNAELLVKLEHLVRYFVSPTFLVPLWPAPMPRTARPFARRSREAIAAALTAGWRLSNIGPKIWPSTPCMVNSGRNAAMVMITRRKSADRPRPPLPRCDAISPTVVTRDRVIRDEDQQERLDWKFAHAFNNRCAGYLKKGDYDHAMQDRNKRCGTIRSRTFAEKFPGCGLR